MNQETLRSNIFRPDISFEDKARSIFRYQAEKNPVYRRFISTLGLEARKKIPLQEIPLDEIPLLPARAFRESRVTTTEEKATLVFRSSGTTRMERSFHEVPDPGLYEESVCRGFDHFYARDSRSRGSLARGSHIRDSDDLDSHAREPVIWAYTPRYEDNPDSSLVWMLKKLIEREQRPDAPEQATLSRFLQTGAPLDPAGVDGVAESGRKLILFGAAFGLFDLAEKSRCRLPEGSLVIETGGMKTERREIGRRQLHQKLAGEFGLPVQNIHSEYGMCEMLSQAYATEEEWFESVPWMKVTVRDPDDPQRICSPGEEGLIGVIDLANLYSCSFILTGDRGVMDKDLNRFRIYGRWNPENLRGCNFLIDRD